MAPPLAHRFTDHDPASRHELVDLVAIARVAGTGRSGRSCRVRSLSLGGAFVELAPLPVGTLVNLTFSVPRFDDTLSLDAVVHGSADDGVRVLFDSLRASEVWILWQFLGRAAREAGEMLAATPATVIVALDR